MSTFDIVPSADERDLCFVCHAELGNHPAFPAFAHTTAGKTHYVHLFCFQTWSALVQDPERRPDHPMCVCKTPIPEADQEKFDAAVIDVLTGPAYYQQERRAIAAASTGDLDIIRKITQGGYLSPPERIDALSNAAAHPEIIPLLLQNVRIPQEYDGDLGMLLGTVLFSNSPSNADQVLAALLAILATGIIDQRDCDTLIESVADTPFSILIPKLLPHCPISDEARGRAVIALLEHENLKMANFLLKTGPVPTEDLKEALELFKK
ncbi:MAG TPA: hypothetical protein VLE89_08695 [Chlamydiales bacterium]|nr:hypothetical protein [Chlamydiales bacterium]